MLSFVLDLQHMSVAVVLVHPLIFLLYTCSSSVTVINSVNIFVMLYVLYVLCVCVCVSVCVFFDCVWYQTSIT